MFDIILQEPQVYPYLKLVEGEKCNVLKSVIFQNRTPLYFQKVYLPVSHFGTIQYEWAADVDLMTILNSKGNSHMHHMVDHFSPVVLSQLECDLLELPNGSAGHLMRTQVFNAANELMAFIINTIPGEFVELEVNVR
jgi:DNA-binding GntR family transcriptional regulator